MRARRNRQEKIGELRRELSGRKAPVVWKHEVRGVREREREKEREGGEKEGEIKQEQW